MRQTFTVLAINFSTLANQISGEVFTDSMHLTMYATDASVYRERPLAVIYPKTAEDVQRIVAFAIQNQLPIIPRAAGTSLAGQVVGNGIVVDCSKYMNHILEVNEQKSFVVVEPGVILDELNQFLEQHNLFFGPETSTSTHCTVGGMFGNNSCGTHSIIYGSVRDHILEAEVVLANGDLVQFQAQSIDEFQKAVSEPTEQSRILSEIKELLDVEKNRTLIEEKFPPPSVIRRNTGYALDSLANSNFYKSNGSPFNICELLAGSEGTLAFTTKLKLHVNPLPPKFKAVVCLQHKSIAESCKANLVALEHKPTAVELMDDIILNMARQNPIQNKQSKFIEGSPKAILLVEFMQHTKEELNQQIDAFLANLLPQNISHHHVILYDDEVKKVWNLRKAGLGVLGNMVGDRKPVALIEDTAVDPKVLPQYVAEFEELIKKYDNECVFYAHISVGELHLRPILNLKQKQDRILFRKIGQESAELVAKYNGSISGEHGDGRLRGEFIPIQYGVEMLSLFQQVKNIFDPTNRFNPQKIVNTAPMDDFLRYENNQITREFDTKFDFSSDQGILRAAEKCNGVGYCRKSPKIGGTMCPSFQATRSERDSTRARANTLREILTKNMDDNPFADEDLYEALDLCLSCKACKTECPSSVDMAKLKAESLYQRYKTKGIPTRSKQIAYSSTWATKFHWFSPIMNTLLDQNWVKKIMGFAPERSLPKIKSQSLKQWEKKHSSSPKSRAVYLFNDEFTNLYDVEIGKKAIELLNDLGYEVRLINDLQSGRTFLSKALLDQAVKIAKQNVSNISNIVSEQTPLLGIEPSAILTFRDEYIDLLRGEEKAKAKQLAKNVYLIEEFLENEIQTGNITSEQFSTREIKIKLHGHCQQKAMIGNQAIVNCLSVLKNATIEELPSGCCGMAGSFGYEKEHYDLSMKIGELVLFPAIRESNADTIIAALGTSCRHQIADGTGTKALHPIEILWEMRN